MEAGRDWRWGLAATVVALMTGAVAVSVGLLAAGSGSYGLSLFVAVPFFIGFFPVAALRARGPREFGTCLVVAMLACLATFLGFLLVGLEGILCIAMALPLALPITAVGAWAAYALLHRRDWLAARRAGLLSLIALLGATLLEGRVARRAPTFTVTDGLEIAAPPEAVWNGIVEMGTLPPPDHWIFRIGFACPERTEIVGAHIGGLRRCTLSTGALLERITDWQPGRRLAWVGVSTPPPLVEINPFREVDPPHLHGFYRSRFGEFVLKPASPGRTRVIRRSVYEHNLYPAWYWKLWSDYATHQGHRFVLRTLQAAVEPSPERAPIQWTQTAGR